MRNFALISMLAVLPWLVGCAEEQAATDAAAAQPAEDMEHAEHDTDEAHGAHAAHQTHEQLGRVDFPVSCNDEAQSLIETGLAHLHHMMYERARSSFDAAAQADADCAMAQWGIAMTSFQPLWHPTADDDLARGKAAVAAARQIGAPTPREEGYIAAVEAFFTDPEPPAPDRPSDHAARVQSWKAAQAALHEAHPDDVDAAAFYALAQICAAPSYLEDDSFTQQRQAGALLERYLGVHPEHPGLFHYLIHAYDNPALAEQATAAARGYDQLAPETPHALHMPSHIFVRLGQWQETAEWNERSAAAALEHPVNGQTSIHYPHALDYMMYAYLQLGDEAKARATLEKVEAIESAQPVFGAAYGIAAPRARYYLEREQWEAAAALEPGVPDAVPWDRFPAAAALIHFARGLGAARSGDPDQADAEHAQLEALVSTLEAAGDHYWANQTRVLAGTVAGWAAYARDETDAALAQMSDAADLEESMDKHPITPGEIRPARELYGEMLLLEGRAEAAQAAFEATLERTPNRRHALRGIERATDAVAAR